MKKIILMFTLCLLLLCSTACGNTDQSTATFGDAMEFASSEEMMKHLEGMWVVDANADEKSYYIFQDGQIYLTTDMMYSAQVKEMLDSAVKNGGLKSLYIQDFANVSNRMYLSDVSITPDSITLFPQNGEIKLYEGTYKEQSIIITKESVLLITTETKTSTAMVKLSDTADFSMKRFEEIYNEVFENYAVPTSLFWLDTKEYGEMVKKQIPSFDWWSLAPGSDSKVELYVPPKELTALEGSLLSIKKDELLLAYDVNVSSWDNSWKPSFTIIYSPESGYLMVNDKDNNTLDLLSLVQYGVYAVQNFPGAYTDPVELYNAIANTELVSSDDNNKKELTINGLTYTLYVGTDGTWGMLDVRANKTIRLGDILKSRKETTGTTEPVTTPAQSGTLEQLLDGTKSWVGPWECDGWEYNVHFVFKEDGTCYFALSEMELFGAGVGTYTVKDGKTLSVKMTMNGEKHSVTYAFNPEDFSLTVTSKKGLVAEKGEVVFLQENTDNDAETVEGWAEMLAEGLSEEDEDLLWESSGSTSSGGGNASNGGNSSNGGSTSNGGNSSTNIPVTCEHSYTEATCVKPKTCTKCGAISGIALGHTYNNATCTIPQTCKTCGATAGSAAGHKWKSATCTHPETCSICNQTQGDALGHNIRLTKCSRCDHADYSAIAKSYSRITAYDSKTGEDLVVTNVSVSNAGVLSFTFNAKDYSISIKERVYDSMTYFDCYQNGNKLNNAECRIGDASYYNMLHFEWDGVDGHRLYFNTGKQ